jgi:Tol biopolymer transport system component
MNADGTGVPRLTEREGEHPAWSPDGQKIAFMSQELSAIGDDPDYNVYVMNAHGSGVRRLTTWKGEDGWPAWSARRANDRLLLHQGGPSPVGRRGAVLRDLHDAGRRLRGASGQ